MNRLGKIITKILSGVLVCVFMLVFLSFIGIQGTSLWLKSDRGGAWLETQLAKSLNGTGYKIDIRKPSFRSFSGVSASEIQIIEEETGIRLALIKNAQISFQPHALLQKKLSLIVSAKTLNLENLPQSNEAPKDTNPEFRLNLPDQLPDIYIKELGLQSFKIDDLVLSDTIFPGGLQTSLNIEGQANLTATSADMDLDLSLKPGESAPSYLPHNLKLVSQYDAEKEIVFIAKFDFKGPAFSGAANLSQNNQDILEIDAESKIENGVLIHPELQEGKFTFNLSGSEEILNGQLQGSAKIADYDANLSSPVELRFEKLSLNDIQGQFAEANLDGQIAIFLQTGLTEGQINLGLKDASPLEPFIGNSISFDKALASLNLFAKNNIQSAKLNVTADNLNTSGVQFAKLNSNIEIPDVMKPTSLDGEIILSNGKYQDVILSEIKLKASPVPLAEGQDIPQSANWNLSVKGRDASAFSISGNGLASYASPDWQVSIADLTAKIGAGNIEAKGEVGSQSLLVNGEITKLNVADIPTLSTLGFAPTISNGTFALTNTLAQPVIRFDAQAAPFAFRENSFSVGGNALYENGKASFDVTGKGKGISVFEAQGNVPVTLSFLPFAFEMGDNAPINAKLQMNAEAAPLLDLAKAGQYEVTGSLSANADVTGTLQNPVINGNLSSNNLSFFDPVSNIRLRDIESDIILNGRTISIRRLTAKDANDGRVSVAGTIGLDDFTSPVFNLNADAKSYHLLQGRNYDGHIDADVAIKTSGDDNHIISGTIDADEILITLPDRFGKSIPELNIIENEQDTGESILDRLALDLTLNANNQIFVRGRGLDAEFGGSVVVTGFASAPDLNGKLEAQRGRFDMFGKRFELERAILRFQGRTPPSPYLDILAVTDADDVVGQIGITGRVSDPQLKLSSVPSLPDDEILSRILFGSDPSKISPFQALQLANSLAELSGKSVGPGLDPLGKVRAATGLDDLRVDSTDEGASVGAGKYLSDNVYLGFEQGAGDVNSTAATVEVEVTPNITVESELGNTGAGGGVSWEWDY